MKSFDESTFVLGMPNASFFASSLFFEAFHAAFPVPPADEEITSVQSIARRWWQYVAFYQWADSHFETVAFANFIRHGEVYLVGGLCARRSFYRRLPPAHWRQCRDRGGIVQMLLEKTASDLRDAAALFGYCGDKKSWLVSARVGYVRTTHRYLIVKWLQKIPPSKKRELEDDVAKLGPF